jgi:hypothetical protein
MDKMGVSRIAVCALTVVDTEVYYDVETVTSSPEYCELAVTDNMLSSGATAEAARRAPRVDLVRLRADLDAIADQILTVVKV